MILNNQKYVIGIDGGGANTEAILSNLDGMVLAKVKVGPSNLNKVGKERAVREISRAIVLVTKNFKKEKVVFTYIGLAGGLQRDKKIKREIERSLKTLPKIKFIFNQKVKIEGDERAAFRVGTNKKEGVLLISGAGSLAYGWRKGKEEVNLGWDYLLGDEGSGFWLGQKALQAVCRFLDGRGPNTLLTNLIFKNLKIKEEGELIQKIYKQKAIENIISLSPLVDKAAKKGDKLAKNLLIKAGQELALAGNQVIKKLNFEKVEFPIVLAGGTFNSKIVLETVKKEIKKIAPRVEFIRPKKKPVFGAVKLAIEEIKNEKDY